MKEENKIENYRCITDLYHLYLFIAGKWLSFTPSGKIYSVLECVVRFNDGYDKLV